MPNTESGLLQEAIYKILIPEEYLKDFEVKRVNDKASEWLIELGKISMHGGLLQWYRYSYSCLFFKEDITAFNTPKVERERQYNLVQQPLRPSYTRHENHP